MIYKNTECDLKPECVTGLDIKIEFKLIQPVTEKFADKFRREFEAYMVRCIEKNPLLTPRDVDIYISNKMKK